MEMITMMIIMIKMKEGRREGEGRYRTKDTAVLFYVCIVYATQKSSYESN